jgi:hypothetical protein
MFQQKQKLTRLSFGESVEKQKLVNDLSRRAARSNNGY